MTTSTETLAEQTDRILWLPDLRTALGISAPTLRRWRAQGRFPKPDVEITSRVVGWRLSTLHAAGIKLP